MADPSTQPPSNQGAISRGSQAAAGLIREFAASLRSSRRPRDVLERLASVLQRSLGGVAFSGYVLRGENLLKICGEVGEGTLTPFDNTQATDGRLAVPCLGVDGPVGAFVVQRDGGVWEFDQEFVETLGACTALALQKALAYEERDRVAGTDSLTGLFNRRFFLEMAEREWSLAKRHETPLSLILLDVDHLKRVNDLYGQDLGDEVLRGLAQTLQATVRSEDLLARYGAERFVVLLPQITLPEATWGMAERLRRLLEDSVWRAPSGDEIKMTVSLGVSTFDAAQDEIKKMLHRAEDGLSMAKALGRNRSVALDLELMPPEGPPLPRRGGGGENADSATISRARTTS